MYDFTSGINGGAIQQTKSLVKLYANGSIQ